MAISGVSLGVGDLLSTAVENRFSNTFQNTLLDATKPIKPLIPFKPIKLSETEERYFNVLNLQTGLPMLQKADVNQDGRVTRQELVFYRNALQSQKYQLNKMLNEGHLVMDAVTTKRVQQTRAEALQKIDQQMGQIEQLFIKDKEKKDVFSKLVKQLGDGKSLNLQTVSDLIDQTMQASKA